LEKQLAALVSGGLGGSRGRGERRIVSPARPLAEQWTGGGSAVARRPENRYHDYSCTTFRGIHKRKGKDALRKKRPKEEPNGGLPAADFWGTKRKSIIKKLRRPFCAGGIRWSSTGERFLGTDGGLRGREKRQTEGGGGSRMCGGRRVRWVRDFQGEKNDRDIKV